MKIKLKLSLKEPVGRGDLLNEEQTLAHARAWLGYRVACLDRALKDGDGAVAENLGGYIEYWRGFSGGKSLKDYTPLPARVVAYFAMLALTKGPTQRDP